MLLPGVVFTRFNWLIVYLIIYLDDVFYVCLLLRWFDWWLLLFACFVDCFVLFVCDGFDVGCFV